MCCNKGCNSGCNSGMFGNLSSCSWIIIIILLWYFCCNNNNNNGCSCEKNEGECFKCCPIAKPNCCNE